MNKNKTKLVTVLSAITLGMALVSCDGTEESSSEEVTISRISNPGLPYLVVAEELDLDQYISVKYSDESEDHDYTVTCDDDAVIFDKHIVICDEPGQYQLDIKSGSRQIRAELTVVTEDHGELIDLFEPLADTPDNYVAGLYSYTSSGISYIRSYYHTENYVAIFDEDDPTATYEDDDGVTQPNSTLVAKLNDGHAYWGYVGGTKKEPKPVFKPGYAMYDAYYITGDLNVDASDFTYQKSTKMNLSSTTFEENLMSYACGLSEASLSGTYTDSTGAEVEYQYSYAGAYLYGLYDFDSDKTNDTALFACMVNDDLDGGSGIYCMVSISFIGNANVSWMDAALNDSSYVPEKIKAPEISTAFAAIAASKNYTMKTEMYSADSSGKALPIGTDISNDCLTNISGSTKLEVTTTYTEKGVISKVEGNSFEKSGDIYVGTETLTTRGEFAYWDDGKDTYTASYDSDKKGFGTATKSVEGKTVYESGRLTGMTVDTITEQVANETIWTSKTVDETKSTVTFEGQAGDNDKSEVTNTLFGILFNLNGFGLVSLTTGDEKFGDFMTEAQQFTGGTYHALTCYSDYSSVVVNTTTNEVSISTLLYVPVGLSNYIVANITFSDIGTTANSFPSITTGGETGGSGSAASAA